MKKIWVLCIAALMAIGMMAQPPRHHDHNRDNDREYNRDYNRDRGHHSRPTVCATPEQLSMTLQVVSNQSLDDKKLEIAKLAVTLGHFCTDDLARIASLFSFDDSRLAFLLYAYDYCEDPQRYPSLRDVFNFRSNYDKLRDTLHLDRR
jgi:hypothetical protein